MKKQCSLKFILVSAFLLTQGILSGQEYWSNPASWGGSGVPQTHENVVIPQGKTIILDTHTPSLGSLTINGTLKFKDSDVSLTARWIMVHGLFQIGTEATPFQSKDIITLTGPKEDVNTMGGRFLVTMNGGSLQLHGASASKLSWGQLEGTVAPGATTITLDKDPMGWEIGDQIAIAASGFEPYEAEEVTITGISGKTIRFTPALAYDHFGEVQEYAGKVLDERAEVAMLTRNIKIQGAADAVEKNMVDIP